MMRLVVEIITGRLFYVEVDDNATVRDLKREIGSQGRLSVSIDRLIIILVVQHHHLSTINQLIENGSSGEGSEGCCSCTYLVVEDQGQGHGGGGERGTLLIECGVRDGSHIHLCFTPPPSPHHPISSSSNVVDVEGGGGGDGSHIHLSSFFTLTDDLLCYGPSSASS